jgi:tetratricopeptide (TPR) repeat protein
MNKHIKYFLSFILVFYSFFCFADQKKIDSLRTVLKNRNMATSSEFLPTIKGVVAGVGFDTSYIKTLTALASEFKFSNPDTAIILSTQALQLSQKNNWQKGESNSYNQLGIFNYFKGNYPVALDYYFKSLKIKELLNDKKGISVAIGNMGLIYYEQGDYPKALDYYLKAMKMAEELKDKNGMARNFCNIGNVYLIEKDYSKALNYFFKAVKTAEEIGDKQIKANTFTNIGRTYSEQKDFPKTLEYYFKALDMAIELGNKNGAATDLGNIGNVYCVQKDYPKALDCFFKALKMDEELGKKKGIATQCSNIGSLYIETKKYKDAEKYLDKALALSEEINALDLVKANQQTLSEFYSIIGQPAKALEHYKKYVSAKDSIFNEENTKKTVRSEMNFDFDKKRTIEKAEQEKQNEIAQQEKQKQKIILILVSSFLLLVAVFASFMFNRWRITQKQKLIIEKQKEKIVDSITYAQLIQQSILMEESEIQKLLPDSFIYYQPKDIVSGDFYWCSDMNDVIILAAIDCTGHGVPGAFMSMIGNTLLNQIVNEKQIIVPSEILHHLNLGVTEALHQKKEGALSRDGMDAALCCIDFKNNQIQYAGAQNPLYISLDNEIKVINADIQSIGGELISKKKKSSTIEFTNHIIPIKKGMSIYLFSDGYMDQFGGSNKKKFGVQRFKEMLLNNQQLNMQQQKEVIAKAHEDWKGSVEQIDDVLVIGLRL